MARFNFKKLFKKEEKIEILTMEDDKDEKNIKSFIKKNSLNLLMTSLTIIVLVITGISISTSSFSIDKTLRRAGIYTQEIKSVELESDNYDAPGSFKIDKSAKWIGKGKAQITFDVNSVMKTDGNKYHDVILVLDISGSMEGEKLDKAKSDSIELVNYLLNDSHNKVAIITFDSTSEIISSFSNNKKDLVNKINNLSVKGSTNYNAALNNVDVLMNGYQKEANRDIVTLFLTDGYPNEDTPNQVGTRDILKDKYPYMTINGIQYEMGKDIIEEIRQITDRQWVADQSTLNNVLFDAAVSPVVYEDFIVTDYIHNDYFKINSIDDIKVTMGTVELTEENGIQKITWNLGDNSYITGGSAKMYINLNQKEEYLEEEGYYPTNKKANVSYKLPEKGEKAVSSSDTPVLKNVYEVIYDTNTPDGCTLESIPKEKYFVYQNVTKKTNNLSCDGYLFKGWEIDGDDEEDIVKVNDDVFQMPGHDVVIRATWSKQDISKSMDGTVHERTTLYKVLENAAKKRTYAREYTGSHQDSMDPSKSTEKIYHWYGSTGIQNRNNVIFANHCWQMIRTTDTGGVKLLYNGESVDNKCLSTRGTHVGYAYSSIQNLSSNYWYGTDYTYDSVSKTFKISGTTEQTMWNDSNGPGLIGKYTCMLTSEDGTCSTLYLVESYYNTSSAYVILISSNSNYSIFGKLVFSRNPASPAGVGYMYNHSGYSSKEKKMTYTETVLTSSSVERPYKNFWYADSITWGSPVADRYNLDSPYQMSSTTDDMDVVGKYTFRNITRTYTNTKLYYIAAVSIYNNNIMRYYIELGNESESTHDLSFYNYTYTYGDSYIDNGDGTYTIINQDGSIPTTIERKDWYTRYSNVGANKYICKNAINDTCSDLWYTTSTSSTYITYTKVADSYKYSKSFTWDGSKYVLNDDTSTTFFEFSDINTKSLNNAHYTCWNTTGECTIISYIYYGNINLLRYINLTDGKNVETALNEMLYVDGVNSINSTMKSGVEAWYKHYLLDDYDDYIEDTIFCNDRSINQIGGWNPDGGNIDQTLKFKESDSRYRNAGGDLSCTNITDKFSTLNDRAKLIYKVGLMSSSDMTILGIDDARKSEQTYWLASPYNFDHFGNAYNCYISSEGDVVDNNVYYNQGVRPAISLIPGIEYSDGDGSMEHPYIVDLDE